MDNPYPIDELICFKMAIAPPTRYDMVSMISMLCYDPSDVLIPGGRVVSSFTQYPEQPDALLGTGCFAPDLRRFPEMGVPQKLSIFFGFSTIDIYKSSILRDTFMESLINKVN